MILNITLKIYGILDYIYKIFQFIINNILYYIDKNTINDIFNKHIINIYTKKHNEFILKKNKNYKIKVGLLTNEIPPIVYGGVATWIVNFIKMFKNDEHIEVIPIFLAHQDKLPNECLKQYPNIRIINNKNDMIEIFNDIDICINNLWVALDYISHLKYIYPELNIITVCHSLIRMENITNLGSCYTNNFNQQEITFQESDYVVLISKSEEKYYNLFGYNLFDTKTCVIYNSYEPKYDNIELNINYESDDIGYIGRHVPRKRPELPIKAVNLLNRIDINVVNMGVDYDKYDNEYWRILEKKYKNQLNIIPFTNNKKIKEKYWETVGINCITGIYEPFGYTICEALDRRIPIIVSDIDGPSEIIDEVKDKKRAIEARKCLDKLRPEVIKDEWKNLIYSII
jgi:glycosyltransferase involved in cell wall biosynthesis